MKCCSQCLSARELSFFSYVAKKERYASECKPCVASRAKRWAEANPDRVKETQKAVYARNKERVKARAADWAETNRAEHLKHKQKTYIRNKQKWRQYYAKWAAKYPEKRLEYDRMGRERHKPPAGFSNARLLERLSVIGHSCFYCKGPATTIDHVIPLSRGGGWQLVNLKPACRSCNSRKGARTYKEFLEYTLFASEVLNGRV